MITRLGIAIDELLKGKLGISRAAEELKALRCLEAVLREDMKKNVSFEKFTGGILYISARNSSWAQQANLMKMSIMSAMNKLMSQVQVKDLRIKSGFEDGGPAKKTEPVQKKCPVCGADHYGSKIICAVCGIYERNEKISKLFRLVVKDPKISFTIAKKAIVNINEQDLKRVKRDLKEMDIDKKVIERRSRGKAKVGRHT